MSQSSSKSRRSKRSKAESAPRPRNRRLDADEVMVAQKMASKSGKAKAKRGGKAKETAAERREERRLQREARRAEKEQARQERKARWAARTAWLQDPRVQQISGILGVAVGGFMVLAGISALVSGQGDIRLLLTETAPGAGSYGNWLGALGARWAFTFMRGGFGIAAPLFGAWLVAAGLQQFAEERTLALGRAFRSVLAAAILLPWTAGLLTLSFDVETGLVTGWGDDHVVGAVGLWLTQWSRFTLGVLGSVLALAAGFTIWAVLQPGVSAFLSDFFAREEVPWEEGEEAEVEVAEPRPRNKTARELAEEEEADWEEDMEAPEPTPVASPDPEPEPEVAPDRSRLHRRRRLSRNPSRWPLPNRLRPPNRCRRPARPPWRWKSPKRRPR